MELGLRKVEMNAELLESRRKAREGIRLEDVINGAVDEIAEKNNERMNEKKKILKAPTFRQKNRTAVIPTR